jgi:hypothetical protein
MKTWKFEVVPIAEVMGKPDNDAEMTRGESAENGKSPGAATGRPHHAASPPKAPRREHSLRVRAGSGGYRG